MLKWAVKRKLKISPGTCIIALEHGHTEVCTMLHKYGICDKVDHKKVLCVCRVVTVVVGDGGVITRLLWFCVAVFFMLLLFCCCLL